MSEFIVKFDTVDQPVHVPAGTLLSDAAQMAGIEINQPCGGQGRCGRCAVQVISGDVRRRSDVRLSAADITSGYALACQTVIESDVTVVVPPQEKVERRLTTDRVVGEVVVPAGYDFNRNQSIRRIPLSLTPPSMDDQTDDWSRLRRALRQTWECDDLEITLPQLHRLGETLRAGDWQVTAIVDTLVRSERPGHCARLIELHPGRQPDDAPLWGVAIDIGTTTVTVWLVDLLSGQVAAQVSEYNQQITRGEDVISRIIYATKGNGGEEMRGLVLGTINELLARACDRVGAARQDIVKATVAGNSTMIHLFLGVPTGSIRLAPFVTAINNVPPFLAGEIGLEIHPEAMVDCLPGVASYVGSDITAGVLSSGMDDTEQISLFIDVGTNGETVLGSKDWLVTCACSAGPAFEGAGVLHGMRATQGAIEEIWVNSETLEPSWRVIGDVKPRGLCGSALISLLAELFLAGVVDKGGHVDLTRKTPRVRQGQHGGEYVVAWGHETENGQDIVFTYTDIDNLLRAKAAIYAGFAILADSVGLSLDDAEQVLIGGSFGKYINVEKAIHLGLLPDMPWDRFKFLGNTSVLGAYRTLLDRDVRTRIQEIAGRMTYIELSADNRFFDAFTSALFLPHTDMDKFPSVEKALG